MNRQRFVFTLILILATSFGLMAQRYVDFSDIAQKSLDAVVHVKIKKEYEERQYRRDDLFRFFFGDRAPRGRSITREAIVGKGSGVIISDDGYIVTNNHVIRQADKLEVTLNNKKTYDAVVIGKDPSTDLALIKIEAQGLQYLKYGNSDKAKIGEWVLAVGNPFNLNSTVTAGIISAKSRELMPSRTIQSFIQTDAVINPGNSGGALVNTKGELIGINTAISTHSGVFEGYSFAIPSNIVKRVISDIKEYGEPQRAFLGIVPVEVEESTYSTQLTEGVVVGDVSDQGAAKHHGIREGDVIYKIDTTPMRKRSDLFGYIASKRPGDRINVFLNREGVNKSFTITLRNKDGKMKLLRRKAMKFDATHISSLDITIQDLRPKQKHTKRVKYGVLVTRVSQKSPLSNLGIDKGSVILELNNQKVYNVQEFNSLLNQADTHRLRLTFRDNSGAMYKAYVSH